MAQLSLSLLGTVHITSNGRSVIDQAYAKVVGLVAYLAVESDRPHLRASLATLFWPEQSDERARHSLRQALSTLRRLIEDPTATTPYLLVTRDAVQFNRESDATLDVRQVLELWDTCERHQHARLESCVACAHRLEQLVGLVRGDFLAGFSVDDSPEFDDWVQVWRQRIHQRAMSATSALASWHEHRGALDQAAAALTRQLELDPWQESAHRKLMEVLWRSGKRSEAMAQYARCRQVLEDELGVEPDDETTALFELISSPDAVPNHLPARAARSLPVHRLPVAPGRLLGREVDLEEVADLLSQQDCRLLTLVGPGGSGKTRLAIQIAIEQSRHVAGTVSFVALAAVREPAGIVPAIAAELGLTLQGAADPERHFLEWIGDRTMFLVLDNLEHLLDGMDLVPRILAAAPEVTILATSRERLHLQGEWVYEVSGLEIPTSETTDSFEGYGAIELFNERLRQVRPRIPLRHEERPQVVRICQLVEGMPLAIELAAAWAQTLSLEQIADQLRKNLDFLSTSLRDVPARHRSMRAVFNQTWEMLTPEEQAVYCRLSVFRDGFRLEAAEAIADTSSFDLAVLVGKSLVTQQVTGRYRLHGLLKQFANEEALRDPEAYERLHGRHAAWYLERLAGWEEALVGTGQRTALDDIEDDIGNVRVAWGWAIERREVGQIAASGHALWLFYAVRGWMREGAGAFGAVVESLDTTDSLGKPVSAAWSLAHAISQTRYGGFLSGLGRYDEGVALITRGLATLESLDAQRESGLALNMLASAHRMKGDFKEARRLVELSLGRYREVGDAWGEALSLNDVGLMSHFLGEPELAQQCCEESHRMFRAIGDRRGNAFATYNLGMIASRSGDHERARRFYRESLAVRQDSHDQWGIAASLVQLGAESRSLGQLQESRALFLKALRIAWDSSVTPVVLDALTGLASVLIDEGNVPDAEAILDAVSAHPAIHGQLQAQIDELSVVAAGRRDVSPDRGAVETVNAISRRLLET